MTFCTSGTVGSLKWILATVRTVLCRQIYSYLPEFATLTPSIASPSYKVPQFLSRRKKKSVHITTDGVCATSCPGLFLPVPHQISYNIPQAGLCFHLDSCEMELLFHPGSRKGYSRMLALFPPGSNEKFLCNRLCVFNHRVPTESSRKCNRRLPLGSKQKIPQPMAGCKYGL